MQFFLLLFFLTYVKDVISSSTTDAKLLVSWYQGTV